MDAARSLENASLAIARQSWTLASLHSTRSGGAGQTPTACSNALRFGLYLIVRTGRTIRTPGVSTGFYQLDPQLLDGLTTRFLWAVRQKLSVEAKRVASTTDSSTLLKIASHDDMDLSPNGLESLGDDKAAVGNADALLGFVAETTLPNRVKAIKHRLEVGSLRHRASKSKSESFFNL